MPTIKLRPHVSSGLCGGISANVFDSGLLKVTIGSIGSLDRALKVAMKCHIQEITDGTILFSSIAVEYVINMDKRMQKIRQKQISNRNPTGWLNLSNDTLKKAKTKKFPIEKLLDSNETIKNPKFINRRNQIAHGDYRDFVSKTRTMSDVGFYVVNDHSVIPKKDALDQFRKCSAFVIAWAKGNSDLITLFIEKI